VLFLSFPDGWHSYQVQFARALAADGVRYETGAEFSDRALAARPDVDGVHFQWVENLWEGDRWWQQLRLVYGVRRYCSFAKRLGKRILWTVHNHGQHEGDRWGARFGFRSVARKSDLIIVHSRWSEQFIRRSYRPGCPVVHMPLGNLDGVYAPRRDTADVRRDLGLDPDRPVCGMIGGVRPYRGHEVAIDAARSAGGRWQLLVAGYLISPEYGRQVADRAAGCPAIRCQLGNLTDTEYAEFVRACDIILLPYQDITGSAALLAAWTLSRPVVMSDLPFFREYQPADPAAGLVLLERSPAALDAAVDRLLTFPPARRAESSRAEADRYSWDKIIRPVADIIRGWSTAPTSVQCAFYT